MVWVAFYAPEELFRVHFDVEDISHYVYIFDYGSKTKKEKDTEEQNLANRPNPGGYRLRDRCFHANRQPRQKHSRAYQKTSNRTKYSREIPESERTVSSDFLNLLERLVKSDVDFVIVGGFAGIIHGCTYVTQDIDICCDFSPANFLKLQRAISDLDPVHRMTPGRKKLQLTEKTCGRFKNLYLDTKIGQLDCLSFIDGIGDYSQVKQASRIFKVEDMKIRVLSLNALIIAKRAMNRPQDKQALLQLEAVKKIQQKKQETL